MAEINAFDKLRKIHSDILAESCCIDYLGNRIGKHLEDIQRFVKLFDDKISGILEIEERAIFPHLEKYFDKNGPLFVMNYSHSIIREEFGRLKEALSKRDIMHIQKSTERLAETLKFHIEREDSLILNEAEKNFNKSQVDYLSGELSRQIKGKSLKTCRVF